MAEFPQVGVRCEVKTCQTLDFLPFLCNECCGQFCLTHRSKVSHGCFTGFKQEKEARLENMEQKSGMQCAFDDCKSELIQVTCEHCCCSYCLRHRHQVDHQCSALPQKKTRLSPEEKIQQIIGKDLGKEKKGRGGVRNEIMAAKVSLMKIKLKATGDVRIPQDDRIYLRVLLPYGSNGREISMFFSKDSLFHGVICDDIKEQARDLLGNELKNLSVVSVQQQLNGSHCGVLSIAYATSLVFLDDPKMIQYDIPKMRGHQKLRLIHGNTGEVLGLEVQFDDFQKRDGSPLFSGSAVVIEYVDKDCTSMQLPHFD